jgi:hypothetical protein
MTGMNKGEREDLQRLIRQREKVLKSTAKQRSAELLADFENQIGSEFSFDNDAAWAQAYKEAEIAIAKARTIIAKRCRELGIPDRFAPRLDLYWRNRGNDNPIEKRKEELRRMAQTRIQAIEQKAITDIEVNCLKAQEQIALSGLTSDAARGFIESLPSIEALMPALSYSEIAGEADPPVVEQLVSPNALRQQRYRQRQALRRNATVTPALRAVTSNDGNGE